MGIPTDEDERKLPKDCGNMPDLTSLTDQQVLMLTLNLFFRGAYRSSPQVKQLVINFVRLLDQALWAYKNARRELEAYTSPANQQGGITIGHYYRLISHCETCVNSLYRALKFIERLRRQGIQKSDTTPLIPDPTTLSSLKDTVRQKVRAVRDAIEHTDKDIARKEIPEGQPISLAATNDGVEITGKDRCVKGISYADLATWLQQLHGLAKNLAEYAESKPV